MKMPIKLLLLLFSAPFAFVLHAGAQEPETVDIDLSDVVVVEDVDTEIEETPVVEQEMEQELPEQPVTVVEIPEAEIEGASIDTQAPTIPTVTEALPQETEIVLEIPGQDAQAPGEASMASEETISVDFPDEDVRTILRNVADLFELNLVVPDPLQGRTSLKLRNVSWRQVFEVVLEPLGYTYVEDRNIIRIKSIDELTTEPVDTRVFVVNYARAGEIQGSIVPLVDSAAGGQLRVDARSNALVITERPSRMNKIQEIIERLDRPTAQVMIESKFIEVTNTDTKNVGVNWAMLDSYSLTAGDGDGGPMTRTWGRERSNVLENTDGQTNEETFGRGIRYETPVIGAESDAQALPQSIPYSEQFETTTTSVGETLTRLAGTSRLDSAVFSADQFEVILSALKANNEVKLVSNPTVVTLDNKLAKIAIGERFPLPSYSFNAETGQRQLDEIEYQDIGINLDVVPQVNSAGFINLNIIPEVSSTNRTSLVEGTEIPIIDSRRTETNIMIKDGFTLAIGGLTENSTADQSTRVPLLGDLPGVGRLFRSESEQIVQRNLIIFITAKTLNPDGTTYRDIIDPRVLDSMGIVPSEVPGYDIPQSERELLRKLEEIRSEKDKLESVGQLDARIKRYEYLKMQAEEEAASRR
jgi:type IV pilus assembly protein PilQ